MALSNLDTYENRQALDKWLLEQGTISHVNHGYNLIAGVVVSDYSKVKTTSDGFAHIVQFKMGAEIPVGPKFFAVFVADMKEYESSINTQVDEFFSNQTRIDAGPDEQYVKTRIDRIQEDYRKAGRVIRPIEIIMDIKKISIDKGQTTLVGYVTREEWFEMDGIAQFSEERQVILIPFDNWFDWLELVDKERHDKIQREMDAKANGLDNE